MPLNISDFNLFFCENCNTPWQKSPPLSQQPFSKSWGPVKPPLFENLVGGSFPQQKGRRGGRGRGAHYETHQACSNSIIETQRWICFLISDIFRKNRSWSIRSNLHNIKKWSLETTSNRSSLRNCSVKKLFCKILLSCDQLHQKRSPSRNSSSLVWLWKASSGPRTTPIKLFWYIMDNFEHFNHVAFNDFFWSTVTNVALTLATFKRVLSATKHMLKYLSNRPPWLSRRRTFKNLSHNLSL